MSTPMYDVPSTCLTAGCTKSFGHDLDPNDPCEMVSASQAMTEALQKEFAFLMGVGISSDDESWAKAAAGLMLHMQSIGYALVLCEPDGTSLDYRTGYNEGHRDGSAHHGPCRGLPD